jgi:molybdopterin synthase catalytic subunit
MQRCRLTPEPILPRHSPLGGTTEYGAELTFLGIVRGTEHGQPISGIRYSAYESMALKMLQEIVAQPTDHEVFIQHRLGPVPVGEPSVVIQVWTKHSAASFQLCQDYLATLKQKVPIWKEMY